MAASIILQSICSHQVALTANNYTGKHLLKLMLGAPAGGDTRRIVSPFVCEGRPFHCFPRIHQQLDSTGRRQSRLWSAFKWCFIATQTNDDKSLVSHQTCALTCGIFQPDGPKPPRHMSVTLSSFDRLKTLFHLSWPWQHFAAVPYACFCETTCHS